MQNIVHFRTRPFIMRGIAICNLLYILEPLPILWAISWVKLKIKKPFEHKFIIILSVSSHINCIVAR